MVFLSSDLSRFIPRLLNTLWKGEDCDVGVIDDHGFFQFYFNISIRQTILSIRVTHLVNFAQLNLLFSLMNDVSFTSTELDGAILILPSGASREDLISTDRFHEYARKNAPHWYQYINHYSYTSYANGSLFLVTGCDKTSEWAMACFPYHVGTEKTLDLRYTWTPNYGIPWDDPGTAYTDYYPLRPSSSGNERNKNQCVFLRGLQISLTQQSWQKTLPYDERAKRHYSFILRTPSKFQVRLNSVLVFLRLRLSEERAIDIVSQRNAHLFHPNYVISQVLLAEYPDAELAVLDDTIWCSLVDNEMCTMIEMNALVTKILCHYKIVENNGIISLQAKTSDELDQDTKSPKTPDRSLPFSLLILKAAFALNIGLFDGLKACLSMTMPNYFSLEIKPFNTPCST
ncbi:hypothetical protein CPB84DRAFT_1824164 [Gymnopilus junonius]|uniref:Uncharacterized protein n=1 Tax=Gymnopilus junonius TaxID=109634 RepID=A0A9P5NSZ9_GYMJU|nr:hypothetical protein CPB84DRAFT_1824164 [Gymnopilus junonius]